MVEVASNDGYLLQYFVERNVPVLGIEPAANVAKVAVEKGSAHVGAVLRRAAGKRTGGAEASRPIWFWATTFWRRCRI